MTADRLRAAARLMRERAEAATPGPWALDKYGNIMGPDDIPPKYVWNDNHYGLAEDDLPHIASWHPAVALAVADWLEAEADRADPRHASTPEDCYVSRCSTHRALAVADAYLITTDSRPIPGA